MGVMDNKSKILQFISRLNEAISKLKFFLFINKLELNTFIGTVIDKKKIKKIQTICNNSIIFVQDSNSFYIC